MTRITVGNNISHAKLSSGSVTNKNTNSPDAASAANTISIHSRVATAGSITNNMRAPSHISRLR